MKSFQKIVIIVFIFAAGFIAIIQSCKKSSPPTVTTISISGINQTSAVCGGNVTNNGGNEVISRGVVCLSFV